ncbi:hypothetical protein AN1V17_39830 [Vallitalea sediminicola]
MKRLNWKLIILLTVVMSIVLTGCKSKTDITQVTGVDGDEKVATDDDSSKGNTSKSTDDNKNSNANLDEESKGNDNETLEENDQSIVNDKYSKYLLFINEEDDNTLYSFNKETQECKQVFENKVDYSNRLMKLQKKNYFISNNKMYALDGDSLKTSLVKYMEYPVQYAGDKILYCKDDNVYIQNIADDDSEKLLLKNMRNLYALYEDNIIYIQVDDVEKYYLRYIYKYNIETEELDEIHQFSLHDSNYNDGIRITNSKDLYLQQDSEIKKYDYESDTIIELEEENDDKIYGKVADLQSKESIKGIVLDEYIYLLTSKGDILKLDKNSTDMLDILYWNNKKANKRYDQEKLIKLEDDKMYYENYLMDYNSAKEKDIDKINIINHYYIGYEEHLAKYSKPYMIKDNKTYLESDINKIKENIKEEYQEFTFSSDILAYTRKKDNHLVIIDRKTGDKLCTTDFPVINIKAYAEEVYYNRYDNQFGFYYYSKGEHELIDKNIVLDYAVTKGNIYYSTQYPIKFYSKNRSTDEITCTDDNVKLMMSESDTLYFVEGDLLYKIQDNKKNKELISVIPNGGMISYLFLHNNHIYSGDSSSICTRIFELDKEFNKPDKIIYEGKKTLIYVVEDSLYVYDKINKIIKGNVDFFYPSDSTVAFTEDAVYISNDDSIIYKIILKTLEVKEFYKSKFGLGGEGDSLDMYLVNDRYCVIGNNNEVASHEGMTIIDTVNIINRKNVESGELIYALSNKAYYMDEDNSLKAIDLTNELNITPKTIIGSVSGYTTTNNNNIIFENRNELIMVDNKDDDTTVICNDFSYFIGTKKDEIYYNNINGELVRINLSSLKKDVIGQCH